MNKNARAAGPGETSVARESLSSLGGAMDGLKDQTTNQGGRLQVLPRMRVPAYLLGHTLQTHVVNAIRRNREVDKDDLYGRALADLTSRDNSAVFADVSELIEGAVSGKLRRSHPVELLPDGHFRYEFPWEVADIHREAVFRFQLASVTCLPNHTPLLPGQAPTVKDVACVQPNHPTLQYLTGSVCFRCTAYLAVGTPNANGTHTAPQ